MKSSLIFLFLLLSMFSYSQDLNIPDAVFLNKLISQGVDTNGDGIIQLSEAQAITTLDVNSLQSNEKIEDMEGIQFFTNLTELRCHSNLITSLDVTSLTSLEFLYCSNNQLNTLNIQGLSQLSTLWANNNHLSSIDLTGLDSIWWIWVSNNNLNEIDLSGMNGLEAIWISENQLTQIDFTPTPNLFEIYISGNLITTLEVNHLSNLNNLYCENNLIEEISISSLTNLNTLYIGNNLIEEIDGSQNPEFIELHCQSNPNLIYINMKNGAISTADPDMLYHGFNFYNLPNLQFICMDPGEEYALSESGYNPNNVTVSTTDCTMSVTDIALNELILYPNPVVDFFNITNVNTVSEFMVLDVSGKILFETPSYEITQKEIIKLKTGTYFLILNDESNKLKQFRFIKK
jgi:Leucine-rich repeat (LRR) protein